MTNMHRDSAIELLRAGQEHHRAGRFEQAEALYRQAIARDEIAVAPRLNLGMALQEMGRPVEAAEVLGRLVVEHPDLAAPWAQLARTIASQGFAWEAHEAIARALRATPDTDALIAISELQLTLLQDAAAAESTSRRAVKMGPANVSAWIQLGQVLAIKGHKRQAADAYRRALSLEPANTMAAFFLTALGPVGSADTGASTALADDKSAQSAAESAGDADASSAPAVAMAPPQYVRALFDGCAERFDGLLVGSLQYRTPQMLDRTLSQWLGRPGAAPPGPLAMLDAGCGTGLCGQWMARYRGQLIGVDLSRRMIAEAKSRGVYDELVPGEVVEELEKRPGMLDLVVAADVLVYFGDLARVFAATAAALRQGGLFLFSVESVATDDYRLLPTQRFAHSLGYLQRLACDNGLAVHVTEEVVLRLEKGADVHGRLVLAEKS